MTAGIAADALLLLAVALLAVQNRHLLPRGPGRRRLGDYAAGLEHQRTGDAYLIGELVRDKAELEQVCETQIALLTQRDAELAAAYGLLAEMPSIADQAAAELGASVDVPAPMDRAPYDRPTAQLDLRHMQGELRVPGYIARYHGWPRTGLEGTT